MTCVPNSEKSKFHAEITVIAAMLDEIFPKDTVDKIMEIGEKSASRAPTIDLLLPCARDHIRTQCLFQNPVLANEAQWSLSKLKPGAKAKGLASSLCVQIQDAAEKYSAERPCPISTHMEWTPLVWKTAVLSNFIELYYFGKIGMDGTNVCDYINATLRFIAQDLLSAVKNAVAPNWPASEEWLRWVHGYQAKSILNPLTQRLWDEIGVAPDCLPSFCSNMPANPLLSSS